jgi:iron complex transport system ATP-binding protein
MFPQINVSGISLQRNGKMLLDDVSFSVRQGEYLALIGPNGAGKSTLLKCINRIIAQWTGEIALENVPIQKIPRKKLSRRIAYVQQSASAMFSFTVRQLVEMGRYPHLKPLMPLSVEDNNVIGEAMEAMNITSLAKRSVETLSGGELQKVLIATALSQQADILLLDEPTTYLDYKHQSEIGKILRTLNQQRGKTIIEVTHDVNRAVLDATHVIALSNGKIVFDGNPQFLMEPTHLRTIYDIDFQMVNHPTLPFKLVVPGI